MSSIGVKKIIHVSGERELLPRLYETGEIEVTRVALASEFIDDGLSIAHFLTPVEASCLKLNEGVPIPKDFP